MAESALNINETAILSSPCKVKYFEGHKGLSGTLFLTNIERLIFITSKGTLRKAYRREHWYRIKVINNVRTESGIFGLGKILILEWYYRHKRKVYRYEGINNPEEWCSMISEIASGMELQYKIIDPDRPGVEDSNET